VLIKYLSNCHHKPGHTPTDIQYLISWHNHNKTWLIDLPNCLFACFEIYGYRTDRSSPTGFFVRCSAQTSPLFVVEWGHKMAAQISLHTLVSFVLKSRRTKAVPRLSLLGEQRELTCNLYKLRTYRKLHRFLVSNTATDDVKFDDVDFQTLYKNVLNFNIMNNQLIW